MFFFIFFIFCFDFFYRPYSSCFPYEFLHCLFWCHYWLLYCCFEMLDCLFSWRVIMYSFLGLFTLGFSCLLSCHKTLPCCFVVVQTPGHILLFSADPSSFRQCLAVICGLIFCFLFFRTPGTFERLAFKKFSVYSLLCRKKYTVFKIQFLFCYFTHWW